MYPPNFIPFILYYKNNSFFLRLINAKKKETFVRLILIFYPLFRVDEGCNQK